MKPTRLLLAFIIGILSMLIILASGFTFLFDKTIEKQLMEYGQMTLTSNTIYVDTLLKSTKDLLDSLSLDPDASKLLNHDNLTASELLTGLRRLNKYEASSYFVDSIYMYNRDNNTIYVSSPHMPEAAYNPSDFLDADATTILKNYSSVSNMEPIFRTYNSILPSISEIPYISFIRYNALIEKNKSNVIMVNIRQDILSNLISSTSASPDSILLLSDTSGQNWIISGNKDNYSINTIERVLERTANELGSFAIKTDGKKYIVCHSKVLNDNATLILLADESYIASATNTKGYGTTIILLGLLFGACLILTIIAFKYIWLSIQTQIKNEEINARRNEELEEKAKREKLLSFLHSETKHENLSDETSDKTLLLMLIDDNNLDSPNINEEICKKSIELLDSYNPIATYENDNKYLVIISGEIENNVIKAIKQEIENSLEIIITIFISKKGPSSFLPESYEFISKSIPYKFLFGKGEIITVPMIEEHEMTQSTIADDMLASLSSAIMKLDMAESILILNGIISILSTGSYRSAQLSLLSLSIAIDDALCKIQINNGIEKTFIAGSLIYQFQHLEYIDEIPSVVKDLLSKTEKAITQSKNNRQSEIVSEIVRITHVHCTERDFSINTVSSIIGMTPAYLGKIFKKTLGISFSRFVLNERMEHACSLLKNTDTPIENIVYAVGFGDTPYFYKLFKEANGCTPLKYREEHLNKERVLIE